MSTNDNRTQVVQSGFVEPYTGIGMISTGFGGATGIGTGFYVGTNTILTAWHVLNNETLGLADEFLFLSNGLSAEAAGRITLQNPADQLQKVPFTRDIGIVTNTVSTEQIFSPINPGDPYIFGLDAFVDVENYLEYVGTIAAKTAGFPGDKYDQSLLQWLVGLVAPNGLGWGTGTMWEAQGDIVHADTAGASSFVGDTSFGFDANDDPFLFPGGVNGDLDATGGQSGSPLWTTQVLNAAYQSMGVTDAHRAMGVLKGGDVDGNGLSTFTSTVFESFDQSDFTRITDYMKDRGASQPQSLTNRITGTYDNTGNETLYGSDFRDVLRGLGTAEGGQDILVGGFGNDIYEIEPGFGRVLVWEPEAYRADASQNNSDTIYLKGIDPANVRLSRGYIDPDLVIAVTDPGTGTESYIIVEDQYYSTGAIEYLQFDTLRIDLQGGLVLTDAPGNVNERLFGTVFNDVLAGLGGNDTLDGREGQDTLIGGPGDDRLSGGPGDDTYEYGRGDGRDGILDDSGFDTLVLTDLGFGDIRLERAINSPQLILYVHDGQNDIPGQRIALGSPYASTPSDQIERLLTADNVEIDLTGGLYFRGTDGANTMGGTSEEDFFETLDGDDYIRSYGGSDFLDAGEGDDFLEGGLGGDTYIFAPGHGKDTISEIGRYIGQLDTGTTDTILLEGFLPGSVVLEENNGTHLTIYTSADQQNWIYVPSQFYNYNPGDSPLIERIAFSGGASIDLTRPGAAANALPRTVGETVSANAGEAVSFDIVDLLANDTDEDVADVLSIVGVINEVGGVTSLVDGIITFTPDVGAGGTLGFDYQVSDGIATVPVSVAITYPAAPVGTGGAGPDTLTGTAAGDTLSGLDGADRILGLSGNDSLLGGAGGDTLNGGDGNDTLAGGDGDDRVFAEAGDDSIDGGAGNDLLEGKIGDDTILGGAGNDTLRGSDGSDLIDGGEGDDVAFGGNDDDTLIGGAGDDTLDGSGGNDSISGGDGNDVLVGENGADTLDGGAGNDTLRGSGGNDLLMGGADDDLVFGSSLEDTLFGGTGDDVLDGNQQADQLFGEAGNDTLRGGDGFDTLEGGDGDDVLAGGNGNDVLTGGLGVDILRGNANADIFRFLGVAESAFGSADLIDGIEGVGASGGDVIDLSGIDADVGTAGDQAFTFIGEATTAAGLAGGAGTLWVETVGAQTRIYGIVDDDGVIDLAIRVNDGAVLAGEYGAGDFVL